MPVPSTTTPEPEPHDMVTDTAIPSASMTDTWVVLPGPGGRLGERRRVRVQWARLRKLSREARLGAPGVERGRPGCVGGFQGGRQGLSPLDRIERRHVETIEKPESEGDQRAARARQRVGEDLVSAIVGPHGFPDDDFVRGQVFEGHESAAGVQVAGDALGVRRRW